MDVNKKSFFRVILRGYNAFRRTGKVGFAFGLSLVVGGFVYYAYQPRLVCSNSSAVIDAISIKKDQAFYEHTFKIYNRSLQTITLDDVKASCKCQGVSFDRVIAPHAEGNIKARFAVERNVVGERHAEFFGPQGDRQGLQLQTGMSAPPFSPTEDTGGQTRHTRHVGAN